MKKTSQKAGIDSLATDSNAVASADNANNIKSTYKADARDHNDTTANNLYGLTTLVNNRARVYKGASWNDRAYWLNPATRRFMQQNECSAEIGFRCAMTMVGSPEIYTEDKPHLKPRSVGKLTDTRKRKGMMNIKDKR